MEGESPSDFLPMLSRTPEEMIRIAAENQHPAAMWQYGTDCKKSAGSDLEQKQPLSAAFAQFCIIFSAFSSSCIASSQNNILQNESKNLAKSSP